MRKLVGLLVCLWVAAQAFALSYPTYRAAANGCGGYGAPAHHATMTVSATPAPERRTAGSLAQISAENFETLNSEGGACYHAPSVRRGRPDEDENGSTGGIGEESYHSPVGEVPMLFMLLLAITYTLLKVRTRKKNDMKICSGHFFFVILQSK